MKETANHVVRYGPEKVKLFAERSAKLKSIFWSNNRKNSGNGSS